MEPKQFIEAGHMAETVTMHVVFIVSTLLFALKVVVAEVRETLKNTRKSSIQLEAERQVAELLKSESADTGHYNRTPARIRTRGIER